MVELRDERGALDVDTGAEMNRRSARRFRRQWNEANRSGRPGPVILSASPPPRWRYKRVYPHLTVELERLGLDGWELVTVDTHGMYIFKRPDVGGPE